MMNLTVKTLKGGKFTIEVDPSNSVAEVKAVIVSPRVNDLRCRTDTVPHSLLGDRWALDSAPACHYSCNRDAVDLPMVSGVLVGDFMKFVTCRSQEDSKIQTGINSEMRLATYSILMRIHFVRRTPSPSYQRLA